MNLSEPDYNRHVIDLFEEQVLQYPEVVALKDQNINYTYSELNQRANQFARCLQKKGVNKDDFVAIFLEPGADYILSMLAILKIGAVYVPLDTLAPEARLKDIIDDAEPKLVITDNDNNLKLKKITNKICIIKQLHLESISYSIDNLTDLITPESPIYMMYTSGSTGKPKGVIIPHRAVVNMAFDNPLNLCSQSKMAQFSNIAFDGSTCDIWMTLLNAATLVIINQDSRNNYDNLQQALKYHEVQAMFLPTGYFHQLASTHPESIDTINRIIFGGEQINTQIIGLFIEYRKKQSLPILLINGYGPTETTAYICRQSIDERSILCKEQLWGIGKPIHNIDLYILDNNSNPSLEGELYISGASLSLGYHNPQPQNSERFLNNPFRSDFPYKRMYRTGDKVRRLPTGELLYLGRLDDQVKIGGFRIHLNEIEQQLMQHEEVSLATVVVELGGGMHKMLTAYIVFKSKDTVIKAEEIREFLAQFLPPYMLPAKYLMVDELPLTAVGKVDKKNLDKIPSTDLYFHVDTSSESEIEETIKNVWKHLLNRKSIETHKNLFELGANSLLITEACSRINHELNADILISDMLAHPTIHKLSRFIEGDEDIPIIRERNKVISSDIAIVGMSCRLPNANTIDKFWNVLCQGIDCLSRFTTDDNLVPVRGVVDDVEQFDAAFFGFSPIDASVTDPAQRIFLECAWEALENAGIAPSKNHQSIISVFAGMTDSTYLHENLLKNSWFQQEQDSFQQRIATSTSMLSTQTSYRLNLTGKSVNVNTACSTGLMVVEQACQDLLLGLSDIALAGASSIVLPQERGYRYQAGSIVSPDGYCRPFADNANGTVFSNGVGVVVLKRLEDAIKDNDTIYAVIKGTSVNNDGADKLSFTAPSAHGQMNCIRDALHAAKLKAEDISYIEAHGTATALGDVIEINALSSVYREQTDKKNYCALGSVKANIGHTDAAAGIVGLIKTALCLYHKQIPPLLHFKNPNPDLNLEKSPFYVNTSLKDWESDNKRFAGISSFGVGGTNVHMILGEYNSIKSAKDKSSHEELILLSAKSEAALIERQQQLNHILTNKNLSDVAYTLQTGREDFPWRSYVVCNSNNFTSKPRVLVDEDIKPSVVFLFSGQGSQYPGMALDLMKKVPLFKKYVKKGIEIAKSYLNEDLLVLLRNGNREQWMQTEYAQPMLFIIEYALAKLFMDCGIKPNALMGHSLGEYVAACIAGVFSFEDTLAIVCERGLLMAKAAPGAMLTLDCDEKSCLDYQKKFNLELALHNATQNWVLAGNPEDINQLAKYLDKNKQPFQILKVKHAFHSRLMEPLEHTFKKIFANVKLSAPTIPIVSNVTGKWLSETDAMSTEYWYKHLRNTVRFSEGIECLLKDKHPFFVEIGPGQSLYGFVKNTANKKIPVTHTLPNHHQSTSELTQLLTSLGELWTHGIPINLKLLRAKELKQRIPLPTYPFQRQRYWLDADVERVMSYNTPQLYMPVWTKEPLITTQTSLQEYTWVIFKDKNGLGEKLEQILNNQGAQVIIVDPGKTYKKLNQSHIVINVTQANDYYQLFASIKPILKKPIILHCYSYDALDFSVRENEVNNQLNNSFYSLLYLTQAYLQQIGTNIAMRCNFITQGTENITGDEIIEPINATLIGACRMVSLEQPSINYRVTDITEVNSKIAMDILNSCVEKNFDSQAIAYRHQWRWKKTHLPIMQTSGNHLLQDNGVYLITGGLGGIGFSIAESIAKQVKQPTLILCSRIPNNNKEIELKMHGAIVHWLQADLTDAISVSKLISTIQERFEKLNGVIHAAGIAGGGLIQLKTKEMAHRVIAPKVHGTYYLSQFLKKLPKLDFVVLMSSIAAITGEKGQIDYCAANAFLDSCATSSWFNSKRTISIAWNTWRDVGMSIDVKRPVELDLFSRGNDISPRQGQDLFLKALSQPQQQVVVSNRDLSTYTELLHKNKFSNVAQNLTNRDVLNLRTDFALPQNKTETTLAEIWQTHLHIKQIGRQDDFFDLGGNSLKGLTLVEKINTAFNSNLSIQHIYKAPTIAKIAQLINTENLAIQHIEIAVPLKNYKKTHLNIFFCHPASGMIYCFNPLVSQWRLPMSIYGIQDPSITVGKLLYPSLLEMAYSYAESITKIQPKGPYYLLGYSFGGSVMYEVAHILKQKHQDIGLLALIESWCVFSEYQRQKNYFINQFLTQEMQANVNMANLSWERMQLLLDNTPTTTRQDMLLFKATELNEAYTQINDPLNGWSKFNKGNITCNFIQANHDTIMHEDKCSIIENIIYKKIQLDK